ncbi:hypothetical protein WISP_126217 [Willisornis vidua]|uniref:Ubiquitin-activating enzyme E1 C-terminal domain-containing protein n=1 Tax=Willisornis vidua TaxID=1566151 RepID=A0ABQ9CWE5_9PASS|nr:hypothetical protein WISP_126217 [Willisornis vidua]
MFGNPLKDVDLDLCPNKSHCIMAADSMEIDDALYSRQRYVLGDTAMQKMAQSHVFLSGIGGLGVEIAKNIILAGVKALTVHDTRHCTKLDLGVNFFIHEDDVTSQRNRAEATLHHIAELNPYVHVAASTVPLDETTDLSFLKQYQCVILTEVSLLLQKKINDFCHAQQPPIKFISADVYGVCSRLFCDFGDEFEVLDTTGEEPKEIFISNITQSNPGIVTCLENHPHRLETGQFLTFREVNGMSCLNGSTHRITVVSPYSFSIGDTSEMEPYLHGGIAVQVKTPKMFYFAPLQVHVAMLALNHFQENFGRGPNIGCLQDAEEMLKIAMSISETLENKPQVNGNVVKWLSRTAQGFLPPLAAAVGGVASQEVLKAVTGKFSPLQQWLYIDVLDIVTPLEKVGCGAIGCEMLKNFALLGVGTGQDRGLVTITDPDLIEKSNLNRQFLFRPHHIQKFKSYTAAEATLNINPSVKIDSDINKVCPATENTYSDEFYTKQDVIVTALDNVEARRYIDSRCVANLRPLIDSGTMGTKGHTEVIVPHLTESYNSHFESSFSHKPSLFNKFWQTYPSAEEVLQRIKSGESLEGCFHVIKTLSRRPRSWSQCVELARVKFEKYFSHKALQLLHSFPLDTRLKDGSLFWQSPKRPPFPVKFEFSDPLHYGFIVSAAKLFATVYCVAFTEKVVQTDETARKPDHIPVSSEDERNAIFQLEKSILSNEALEADLQMKPISFEKDDDSNGHIDFITAASNLRAKMYNIEPADRFKTKRIAGKIIPAIATATAAVSGLVALELIKVVGGYPADAYKNCFLNLAIPVMVFTETAEVRRTEIRNGISFTIWDRWTIYGKEDFTLLDFINAVREKYGIEPTMVVQGVKMLYVPVMPGHIKRLKFTSCEMYAGQCSQALLNQMDALISTSDLFRRMQKLVKPSADKKYVDLTVSFAPETDGEEDLPGPPNHLKKDYRARFCHGGGNMIDVQPGQNVLKLIQDCFERQPCESLLKTATHDNVAASKKTVSPVSQNKKNTLKDVEALCQSPARLLDPEDDHRSVGSPFPVEKAKSSSVVKLCFDGWNTPPPAKSCGKVEHLEGPQTGRDEQIVLAQGTEPVAMSSVQKEKTFSSALLAAVATGTRRQRYSAWLSPPSPPPPVKDQDTEIENECEFLIDESGGASFTSWISIPSKNKKSKKDGSATPCSKTQPSEKKTQSKKGKNRKAQVEALEPKLDHLNVGAFDFKGMSEPDPVSDSEDVLKSQSKKNTHTGKTKKGALWQDSPKQKKNTFWESEPDELISRSGLERKGSDAGQCKTRMPPSEDLSMTSSGHQQKRTVSPKKSLKSSKNLQSPSKASRHLVKPKLPKVKVAKKVAVSPKKKLKKSVQKSRNKNLQLQRQGSSDNEPVEEELERDPVKMSDVCTTPLHQKLETPVIQKSTVSKKRENVLHTLESPDGANNQTPVKAPLRPMDSVKNSGKKRLPAKYSGKIPKKVPHRTNKAVCPSPEDTESQTDSDSSSVQDKANKNQKLSDVKIKNNKRKRNRQHGPQDSFAAKEALNYESGPVLEHCDKFASGSKSCEQDDASSDNSEDLNYKLRELLSDDIARKKVDRRDIPASLDHNLADTSKPTIVLDPVTNEEVLLECINTGDSHACFFEDEAVEIHKKLNTSVFATGRLILKPLKEKGYQFVHMDTIAFYIVCGKIIATIHKTSYYLTTGDSFYVPAGNEYNIRNLLNEESVLVFTQLKVRLGSRRMNALLRVSECMWTKELMALKESVDDNVTELHRLLLASDVICFHLVGSDEK